VTSSNEYVIIGIDPGLMTGMFTWVSTGDPEQMAWHVASGDFASDFWEVMGGARSIALPEDTHVAIERYIITPKTAKLSQQTDALEVTGMAKAVSVLHGNVDVRQYVKANLKFASDDMLKAVGWYNPKLRHANDAARQAFALLKDIDYPRWSELVRDAKMEPTTEG